MYGVSDKYIKLQEYPFSSEQKLMAVKCVNKYDDVRTNILLVFIFIIYSLKIIKFNFLGKGRNLFCQRCFRKSFETMYKIF